MQQGPSAAPEEDADDVQKQDRERQGFRSQGQTIKTNAGARCKKESADRVSEVTRKFEMQKKKAGVK